MKINIDYKICERNDVDYNIIQLLKAPYQGILYNYREVSPKIINEGQANEALKLSFTWDLIEGDKELTETPTFERYIGRILEGILHDSFENDDYKIGENNGGV